MMMGTSAIFSSKVPRTAPSIIKKNTTTAMNKYLTCPNFFTTFDSAKDMTALRSKRENAELTAIRKKMITRTTALSALQSTSTGAVNQRQTGSRDACVNWNESFIIVSRPSMICRS